MSDLPTGCFHAGYDPGLVRDPGALAIVEYIEHPRAADQRRRPIFVYVIDTVTMPLEAAGGSFHQQVEAIAEALASLGPNTYLAYDVTGHGGLTFQKEIRDGQSRGLFAHYPSPVRIRGGDGSSETSVGKTELFRNLREMVVNGRLRANPALPGWEDIRREALSMEPELSPKNQTLTFNAKGPGAHDDRVFSLALACYQSPHINWQHAGMRYRDALGRIWPSFEDASAHLGQLVEEVVR